MFAAVPFRRLVRGGGIALWMGLSACGGTRPPVKLDEPAVLPVEVVPEDAVREAAEPAPPAPPVTQVPPGAKVQKVWIWQETNDCLWKMAQDHYGNPFLWPRIYEANRHLIRDPNIIFPKQEILIPPLEEGTNR
jgi:nucleoid-associated protein YgaU